MTINLNDSISFVLTQHGAFILNCHKSGGKEHFYPGQGLTMQLHAFANAFGPYLFNGASPPVVNMEITVGEKKLTVTVT